MKLSELSRVGHCCVICVLVCLCEQCVIFRYQHPHIREHGTFIEQACVEEIERLTKREKKVSYLLLIVTVQGNIFDVEIHSQHTAPLRGKSVS